VGSPRRRPVASPEELPVAIRVDRDPGTSTEARTDQPIGA